MFFNKILDSLKYFAIFMAILCQSLFSIAVYGENGQSIIIPEKAREHYDNGVNKLKEAQAVLAILRLKLSDLGRAFPEKSIRDGQLSDVEDQEAKDKIYAVKQNLDYAVKEFSKAIELAPDYSDAYIRLSETHLAMGNEPEAIKAYEAGLDRGYDNLTIPFEELKPVFHDIAMAYFIYEGKSDEYDPGAKVIEKLISLENDRLKAEYDQLDKRYDLPRREDSELTHSETPFSINLEAPPSTEKNDKRDFIIKPQTVITERDEEKSPGQPEKAWHEKLPERSALFIFAAILVVTLMIAASR